MKKILLCAAFCILVSSVFAQKKEKIKGSKNVTVEIKTVDNFENLDVSDNLEIFLVKGNSASVEIDADDNLHSIIDISPKGKTLYLSTSKAVSGSKKFTLRITYTTDLKQVLLHNEATARSLIDLDLETITFKNYDETKLFVTSKCAEFSLFLDDKAQAEINLKGEKATLNLSKKSELKALIVTDEIFIDQYQKSEAKIEGDCNSMKIRLDNDAQFSGKNLVAKAAELTTELNSKATINVKNAVQISVSGSSEIEFYGAAKVDMVNFTDTAILKKMVLK